MLLCVRFYPESIMIEVGKDLPGDFLKQGAQQ